MESTVTVDSRFTNYDFEICRYSGLLDSSVYYEEGNSRTTTREVYFSKQGISVRQVVGDIGRLINTSASITKTGNQLKLKFSASNKWDSGGDKKVTVKCIFYKRE